MSWLETVPFLSLGSGTCPIGRSFAIYHRFVRHKVVQRLERDPRMRQAWTGLTPNREPCTWQGYLHLMGLAGTYGTSLEVMAACEELSLHIVVLRGVTFPALIFGHPGRRKVWLWYSHEHFVPLLRANRLPRFRPIRFLPQNFSGKNLKIPLVNSKIFWGKLRKMKS